MLGSTAGMLFDDAIVIALGGSLAVGAIWLLRRPMTLVAFDPEYAAASGYNVRWIDLAMMGLVMAITVIGLKIVGLILIVAMLVIPPVAGLFLDQAVKSRDLDRRGFRRGRRLCRCGDFRFRSGAAHRSDHCAGRGFDSGLIAVLRPGARCHCCPDPPSPFPNPGASASGTARPCAWGTDPRALYAAPFGARGPDPCRWCGNPFRSGAGGKDSA